MIFMGNCIVWEPNVGVWNRFCNIGMMKGSGYHVCMEFWHGVRFLGAWNSEANW